MLYFKVIVFHHPQYICIFVSSKVSSRQSIPDMLKTSLFIQHLSGFQWHHSRMKAIISPLLNRHQVTNKEQLNSLKRIIFSWQPQKSKTKFSHIPLKMCHSEKCKFTMSQHKNSTGLIKKKSNFGLCLKKKISFK